MKKTLLAAVVAPSRARPRRRRRRPSACTTPSRPSGRRRSSSSSTPSTRHSPTSASSSTARRRATRRALQRLLRESVAGTVPDVAFVGLNLWRVLEARGLAQELEPFMGDEQAFIDEGYGAAVRLGAFGDGTYALGASASTLMIYVNADLVEQAGGSMEVVPERLGRHHRSRRAHRRARPDDRRHLAAAARLALPVAPRVLRRATDDAGRRRHRLRRRGRHRRRRAVPSLHHRSRDEELRHQRGAPGLPGRRARDHARELVAPQPLRRGCGRTLRDVAPSAARLGAARGGVLPHRGLGHRHARDRPVAAGGRLALHALRDGSRRGEDHRREHRLRPDERGGRRRTRPTSPTSTPPIPSSSPPTSRSPGSRVPGTRSPATRASRSPISSPRRWSRSPTAARIRKRPSATSPTRCAAASA